ncbi:MAG: YHYH domain-containing protein [Phenylobacterium sp.]|uniref:YHYH domain-containing protein n=1 Tax=Phenylobacterium sp. TaxID=1871053 RepID=UPI00273193F9|nr:YHYH domain-containing protein [Phenylobacterium sp.]MDP2008927.1 YHYH domain-containing protein [Phenylobacterium sp.]
MKLLIVIAASLLATSALAHEAPPATKPTPSPAASVKKVPAPATKPVKSHSGGTDAYGCHTNSQTGDYHCHKPK